MTSPLAEPEKEESKRYELLDKTILSAQISDRVRRHRIRRQSGLLHILQPDHIRLHQVRETKCGQKENQTTIMTKDNRELGKTDYFDLADNAIFVSKGIKYRKLPGGPDTGAVRMKDGKTFYFGDGAKVLTLITVTKAEFKKAIVDWQKVIADLQGELAGARRLRNDCFQRYNQMKYGFKPGDLVTLPHHAFLTFESYATSNEHYSPYRKKDQSEVYAKISARNGNVFSVEPTKLKRVKK